MPHEHPSLSLSEPVKMGYLIQAQESKKTSLSFVVITLKWVLWWNILLISPNRAQQQEHIERMMISKDPSYYYNLCAPTACTNITLTYPFTIPSPCHPYFMKPSCAKDNGTLYITNPESNNTFRIFPANFTADPVTVSFVKAYNPLFSCGPISKPNYFETVPASNIYPVDYNVGTHFNCTNPIPAGALGGLQNASCLGCPGQDPNNVCFYAPGMVTYPDCETYHMHTKKGLNVSAETDLRGYLKRGYEMRYVKPTECRGCEATRGRCGVNPSSLESFVCFCPSGVHSSNCSDGLLIELDGVPAKGHGSKFHTRKVVMSIGIGLGAGLVFTGMGYFYFKERRWRRQNQAGHDFDGEDDEAVRRYLDGDNTIPASIETFLQNYTLGRPTRFSYKQLKRYTNNFTHKLGQGGYGSIFKGELPRGLFIAVKLLNDSTDQCKAQFLNEVRIIGQIHHNHLVRLLGYCFERSRQPVLVYEFMENGSLDKHLIHGNLLSWNQLHNIAVGTAKGIMYLHEDCLARILHCDIKPHNILLDRNFRPKVSDFGLALALSREKSHVSLTHGAGTPGYAPPEMWMNCGNVSDKSDVYSFGMVMLEMVGRKRSNLVVTDVSSSLKDQMYFPEWVFLQHQAVVNPSSSSGGGSGSSECQGCHGEEGGIAKRMELVALWCIQFEQSKRPSMRRVIEMLEGDVLIDIPPAPFNPCSFSNIY